MNDEERLDVLAYRRILLDPNSPVRRELLCPLTMDGYLEARAVMAGAKRQFSEHAPLTPEQQRAVSYLVRRGNTPAAARALLGVA